MRSARRRRPVVAVAVLAAVIQLAGTHVASGRQPLAHPLDGFGYLLLLAGPALLLLHRRAPEVMLGGTVAATAAYLAIGYPWGPFPLSMALALILATAARRRVFAWSVAGALVAAVFTWAIVHGGDQDLVRAGAASAWLVILVLIGEGVRLRLERVAERRAHAHEARQRAEDEYRLALARDIHDVVAHSLSMINVRASVALHLADRDPDQLRPALEAIKTASKESLVQVRELLGVLRQDAPRQPGLTLANIPGLVEDAQHGGLAARIEYDGDPSALRTRLGPEREAVVYRVVQEAVTNAVRHSGAKHLAVHIGPVSGDALTVAVDDDGTGRHGSPEGNGLRGMRERLAGIGGSVELVELKPGLGVHARFPLGDEPGPDGGPPGAGPAGKQP
ncbi:sensor histidine kinase [Arthrobacter sp. SDTb3-6]|uniref:sensor histidine kinase n=1 Tax=Arthrobacter sp. SDTb3-6 TaxID=2713571 RepID=UPI00159DBBA0|nr:sensor histidine kinase [Arthrobacter sp. SDTb3-6]NVN00317.1 sensor histidine kinase [Arthrobacter sp. SDTb3-6]